MHRPTLHALAPLLVSASLTGCHVQATYVEADPPTQACTEEARVCEDGSTRVRKGPSCAFDPCPEDAAAPADPAAPTAVAPIAPPPEGVVCTKEAKQCPDGSYVGRTGPSCEFAACPGE